MHFSKFALLGCVTIGPIVLANRCELISVIRKFAKHFNLVKTQIKLLDFYFGRPDSRMFE